MKKQIAGNHLSYSDILTSGYNNVVDNLKTTNQSIMIKNLIPMHLKESSTFHIMTNIKQHLNEAIMKSLEFNKPPNSHQLPPFFWAAVPGPLSDVTLARSTCRSWGRSSS